jgi:putative ABC transport system permease protein
MNRLVVGNLVHRPLRSMISIFAVAIEIIMILSIAAIMLGMLNDQKTRTSGIGMDMIVRPSNSTYLNGVGGAPIPIKVGDVLKKIDHVKVAAPAIVQLTTGSAVENIYGIDFDSYNALRPFTFIEGGPFQSPTDIIVDDYFARADHGHKVGDTVEVLKHPFRISGIVEHGKGGRKFLPITTMGDLIGSENHASVFYLKLDNNDAATEEAVKKQIKATPGMSDYQAQTIDEWLSLMTPEHLPAFTAALYTVIGIAVVIGFLVVFQSMYTAVMERTREIGVLKSLGASRLYIVRVVLGETGLLAICGIAVGIALTYAVRSALHLRFPTLSFSLTGPWLFRAGLTAFVGAILGAAYPAYKAARKDPIDALAYE